MEILSPYKDKLKVITDGEREGLHPLTPILRQRWELIPYTKRATKATEDSKEKEDESQENAEKSAKEEETTDASDL